MEIENKAQILQRRREIEQDIVEVLNKQHSNILENIRIIKNKNARRLSYDNLNKN